MSVSKLSGRCTSVLTTDATNQHKKRNYENIFLRINEAPTSASKPWNHPEMMRKRQISISFGNDKFQNDHGNDSMKTNGWKRLGPIRLLVDEWWLEIFVITLGPICFLFRDTKYFFRPERSVLAFHDFFDHKNGLYLHKFLVQKKPGITIGRRDAIASREISFQRAT